MKAITRLILMLSILFLFSSQVQASEEITADVYFSRVGMKILSGVANVTTGWMELPKNIILWCQKDNSIIVGFPEGVLWGIFHTASRTGNGALDLATFWFPTFPSSNPLFIWDDFSEESSYYGWRMGR